MVFTSGLGGVFPKGIPIGVVAALKIDSSGIQKVAIVDPSLILILSKKCMLLICRREEDEKKNCFVSDSMYLSCPPGTLFQYLSFGRIRPDLVTLFVIYTALHHKPVSAAVYGFGTGLIADMFLGRYIGLYAIMLAAVALAIGFIQQRWYRENIVLTVALVFFFTFLDKL